MHQPVCVQQLPHLFQDHLTLFCHRQEAQARLHDVGAPKTKEWLLYNVIRCVAATPARGTYNFLDLLHIACCQAVYQCARPLPLSQISLEGSEAQQVKPTQCAAVQAKVIAEQLLQTVLARGPDKIWRTALVLHR